MKTYETTEQGTAGPTQPVVMTPELTSDLLGWTRGLHKGMAFVLGAAISVLIGNEVRCKIWKKNWNCVEIELIDERDGVHDERIAQFVLAMKNSEGDFWFEFVAIDDMPYTREAMSL